MRTALLKTKVYRMIRRDSGFGWRRVLRSSLAGAVVLLFGCANTPGTKPDSLRTASTGACSGLAGRVIPADAIGLPSGAARIDSAVLVAATPAAMPELPEYCRLLGAIAPRGPNADAIRFEINLPTRWNGKAVMVGGGGFNGTLVTALAPLRDAAPGQPQPLMQGFATFGTDSGHDGATYGATDPARFALNDEMLLNFAHQAYKKVKDVAHRAMAAYYGSVPTRQYFYGGSEGGREGLTMAQRYPQDFDGIVSVVPVIAWSGLFNGFVNYQQAQLRGGVLNADKIRLLASHVNQTCDAIDGIADGVVSNYRSCAARVDRRALRCPDGADRDNSCLSDAQLATLDATYGPTVLPFALANGLTTYPGRLYGGEVQINGEGIGRWVGNGRVPSQPPTTADGIGIIYGSSYARYVIARDAALDLRDFDVRRFRARIQEVSELMDSTDSDLSAFQARGGKLIIRENSGDMAQSPLAGIEYHGRVVARMSQPVVDSFMRLYVSPASNHAGQAASFTTGVEVPTHRDLLTDLDQWVGSGNAPPDALVQVRTATTAPHATLASRPMCRYPMYPRFVAGDPQQAASYRCTADAP